MKFYKDSTTGKWILGTREGVPSGTCLYNYDSATTLIAIEYASDRTIFARLPYSGFLKENGTSYASKAEFDLATADFFVKPAGGIESGQEVIDALGYTPADEADLNTLQGQVDSVASGFLGAIAYNASAPTPAKSGYYVFSNAGTCSWLSNKNVSIEDNVSVVYTAPNTYTYTYLASAKTKKNISIATFIEMINKYVGQVNLYNVDNVVDDYIVDSTTGVHEGCHTPGIWSLTDYIPCSYGYNVFTNISNTAYSKYGIAWYDANKSYISGTNGSIIKDTGYTVPFAACYFRTNIITAQKTNYSLYCSLNVEQYRSFGYTSLNEANKYAQKIMRGYVGELNLFNKYTATNGKALNNTNGIVNNELFSLSDYFTVVGEISLISNINQETEGGYSICFYDKDKGFIGSLNLDHTVANTPYNIIQGAYFARITVRNTVKDKFVLTFGNTSKNFLYNIEEFTKLNAYRGKGLAVIGDSITFANVWQQNLAKYLDATVNYNNGISGITFKSMLESGTILSNSFDTSDIAIVALGINDVYAQRVLGTISDTKDTNSFYGDVKKMIYTILTYKPTIRLAFFTPLQRFDYVTNTLGLTVFDYSDAIINVCRYYSIPCLDLTRNSGINQYNRGLLLADQIHPNNLGYEFYKNLINKFCSGI